MNITTKFQRYSRFTLVELLIAMVVFTILLGLMLQFFSGAQKMWTGMEKKNHLYANARIAMDTMATLLQTMRAVEDGLPFMFDGTSPNYNKLAFMTQTDIKLGPSATTNYNYQDSLFLVSLSRNTTNDTLEVTSYYQPNTGTVSDGYCKYFRPTATGSTRFYSSQSNIGADMLTPPGLGTAQQNTRVLLEYVTGLSFRPIQTTSNDNPPMGVEITLSMMSKEDYDVWVSAGRPDILRQNSEYTFKRVVFFDDINRTVL